MKKTSKPKRITLDQWNAGVARRELIAYVKGKVYEIQRHLGDNHPVAAYIESRNLLAFLEKNP